MSVGVFAGYKTHIWEARVFNTSFIMMNPKGDNTAFWPRSLCARPRLHERGAWASYLEERVSTLQSGWTQGSHGAEGAPEVDGGQQGARRQ